MRTLRGFTGIAAAPWLRWMNSIAGGQAAYISSSFREEKPRCAERDNSFQFRRRRKVAWLLIQAGSLPQRFAFDWRRNMAESPQRASFISSIFQIRMPRRFSLQNNGGEWSRTASLGFAASSDPAAAGSAFRAHFSRGV